MKYFPHLFWKEHLAHRAWLLASLGMGVLWFVSGLAEQGNWLPLLTEHGIADLTGCVAAFVGLGLLMDIFQTERVSSPFAFWRTRPPGEGVVLASQMALVVVWGILWPALLRGLLSLVVSRSLAVAGEVAASTAFWAFLICLPLAVIASAAKGLGEFAAEMVIAILILTLGWVGFEESLVLPSAWRLPAGVTAAVSAFVIAWLLHWRQCLLSMRVALVVGLLSFSLIVQARPWSYGKRQPGENGIGDYQSAFLRLNSRDPARGWWFDSWDLEGIPEASMSGWTIREEVFLPMADGSTVWLGPIRYRIRADVDGGYWALEELRPASVDKNQESTDPVLLFRATGVAGTLPVRIQETGSSATLASFRRIWQFTVPAQQDETPVIVFAKMQRVPDSPSASAPRVPFPKFPPVSATLAAEIRRITEPGAVEHEEQLNVLRSLLADHTFAAGGDESMARQSLADLLEICGPWRIPREGDWELLASAFAAAGRPHADLLAALACRDSGYLSGRTRGNADTARELLLEALHRTAGPEALTLLDGHGARSVFESYSIRYGWTPGDVPLLVKWAERSLPPAQWLPALLPVLKARAGTYPRWMLYPDPDAPSTFESLKALATLDGYPWPEAAEFLWTSYAIRSSGREAIPRVLVETGVPRSPQRLVRCLDSWGRVKLEDQFWNGRFPDMPLRVWLSAHFPLPEGEDPRAWLRAHAGELTFDAASGRWVLP